jgi:hypothetical protein
MIESNDNERSRSEAGISGKDGEGCLGSRLVVGG